jgi:hypothetical protein
MLYSIKKKGGDDDDGDDDDDVDDAMGIYGNSSCLDAKQSIYIK